MRFFSLFFTILTFFFLSKLFAGNISPYLEPYGGSYFAFVLVGIAIGSYLQLSLSSFSKSIREAQMTGTLEALLMTQTSIHTIIFASSIYGFFWESLEVFLLLSFGVVVFGMSVENANIGVAITILLLTITSSMGVGIISASFIMVFKKGDPLNMIISTSSGLIGGVMYPVSVLPEWVQEFACFIPLTHSLEGMRQALINGATFEEVSKSLIALIIFSVILLPLSLWIFSFAVKKAEIDGTLTHY
jgi:ABC-2 type transport system permease protein